MRASGIGVLLCVLGSAAPAQAVLCGTFLDPISVSATAIAFGNYTPRTYSPTPIMGRVTIACGLLGIDLLPSFTVALDKGLYGTLTQRKMQLLTGTDKLNYNIYTTSASNAPIWGDGNSGTQTQSFSAALNILSTTNFDGYGVLPTGQYVKAGGYSDTITVSVTF